MKENKNQFFDRRSVLFFVLAGFFLTNAIVAEIIGGKIFSLEKTLGINPIELKIFGETGSFDFTAGVLLWPIVFIITDLINEYFGKTAVRKLSYFAVIILVYVFIMLRLSMSLVGSDWWIGSQIEKGVKNMSDSYNAILNQGLFIILGSLVAFLVGQIVDAAIFEKLKKRSGEKMIWLRATGSTVVSQFIDSFVVLFIAFYIGGSMSLSKVMQICVSNYIYKFLVAILLIPILYIIHYWIDKYLAKDGLPKKLS